MPRILIVTHGGFPGSHVEEIRRATPAAEYVTATDDTVLEKAVNIDALIGCPRALFSEELLDRAGKRLRWVHATGAGVEEFLIPRFVESDVVLTSGKIIQGPEVADHAMALLLAFTRKLHLILSGKATGPMPRPVELRGKTAVVVGLGGIGLLIAERAHAFGMRVLGVDPELVPMVRAVEAVYPPERLDETLSQADAVLVAAPLTRMTEGMFGLAQFAAMKRSAYFVLVSRGRIVKTDELVAALRAERLAGAALDVTDPEPLPETHPLRQLGNVILTPHIAGLSDHNRRRSYELVKTNVDRFVRGSQLLNVVDKRIGY